MRLWLDDIRPMPDGFDMHVKTAGEAANLVATGKVTAISFDHDLGPEEAGTGYEVAKAIERLAFYKLIPRLTWSIHSANPVGRANIEQAMAAAERFWGE